MYSSSSSPFSLVSGTDSGLSRVLLIGASNLTFSFPLVINSLWKTLPGPLEIFAVHGHGRSYCNWSYVLHRGLPSVLDCGLWTELENRPSPSSCRALVMDVGNDLIYGVQVDQLMNRLEETFRRLAALGARTTYVRLPLKRVLMLSEFHYRVIKKMLFPGPTVPWKIMIERVVEFDARATLLAQKSGLNIVEPQVEWYGVDPIHLRRSRRRTAWREILSKCLSTETPSIDPPDSRLALQLWRCPPAERTFWNRRYISSQPALELPDGRTLWVY